MILHLEWWPTLGLLMAAFAGWCGIKLGRLVGFDAGALEGYKQGILDASPWTCGQAHANPGTTLMCCKCGMDRFDDSDVLRNVHEESVAR